MKRAVLISITSLFIVSSVFAEGYFLSAGSVTLDFPAPEAVSFGFICNGVDLEWQAPVGETPDGYNVYRRTGPSGDWYARNSSLIGGTTFYDNDIIFGTDFRYAVTAVYGGDESERAEFEPQYLPNPSNVDYIIVGTDSTEWLNYWYKSILNSFGLDGEIVSDIFPYCNGDFAGLPLLWIVSCPDDYFDLAWEKEITLINYLESGGNLFVDNGMITHRDSIIQFYLLYDYTLCFPYLFGGVNGVAGTFAEGLSYDLDGQLWSSNLMPMGYLPETGIVLEDNVQCGCVDMFVDRQGFKAVINSQPIHEFIDGPNGTRREYFLRMMDFFDIQTSIEESDDVVKPEKMFVFQAYPNPFNAQISLNIASSANNNDITITIFDITGRVIRRFENINSNNPIVWDGRNENGRSVSSGVYFARAGGPNGVSSSVKLTLMK